MSTPQTAQGLLVLFVAFLLTAGGTSMYRSFAIHRGIVANPNFRSLHEKAIPRGGGLVFSAVCISGIAGLGLAGSVSRDLALALVGGGSVATLVGFVDDVRRLGPWVKFVTQGVLAGWVLLWVNWQPLLHLPQSLAPLDLALSWLGLVWLMNVYNFMDGIDAMAAVGAIFISTAAVLVLAMTNAGPSVVGIDLVCGLLAATTLGFLLFNRPPASLFMGDSGSLFLGFAFGVLIAKTVVGGQISLWTWLIIFGYFAADTTTTTIVRMFVTDKWYDEHRSHAYQNLARIWGSHLRVVVGVSLYQILWLLPLAIVSAVFPASAPLDVLLGLGPVIVWTLRHGPLRSSS
jgi:glycosyltransferase WbpL